MLGLGIGQHIPLLAYIAFWIMCMVSLFKNPLYGLYYSIPFLPYRTMRDHFLVFPLGANVLTILILSVIVGALIRGKRPPKSKLYIAWLLFGAYLYVSMWLGTALGNAPPPLWLSDLNFITWKDYMLIPLVFFAAGLVIEDREAVKMVVLLAAISLLFIDRSSLFESLTRTWTTYDEDKRSGGPLGYGSNQTAAFLAQFGMFFWGFAQFVKKIKVRLITYGLVAITILATMYTFSRGAYLALLLSILCLGVLKDRKLLVVLGVFLFTWQAVVPAPVRERVMMTENRNGVLEDSAQERIDLWESAERSILASPIVGNGFATYQLQSHIDNLGDTHNWYVKVLVETGLIGLIFAVFILQQMVVSSYQLFKKSSDPLYQGVGLGVFLATVSCMVANMFGDRWTYIEIMGLLWVLVSAALRSAELSAAETADDPSSTVVRDQVNPYLAYR